MPTLGTTWESGDTDTTVSSIFMPLGQVSDFRGIHTALTTQPIVPDFTGFPDGTTDRSLRDLTEGQDWFLKRIVGKIFVSCDNSSIEDDTTWPYVKVTAGFFVARATDDVQGIVDLETVELDPTLSDNVRNPWIWRDQWILRNPASSNEYAALNNFSPTNNWTAYGSSAKDGPHLDIKTARRIMTEHRLWFVAVAEGWSPAPVLSMTVEQGQQPAVTVDLDVRVLGAMRKARGSSSF